MFFFVFCFFILFVVVVVVVFFAHCRLISLLKKVTGESFPDDFVKTSCRLTPENLVSFCCECLNLLNSRRVL